MKEELRISPKADGFAVAKSAPMASYVSHHHDELEVNLVLSGHAVYLFGIERIPLSPGSMIWLFPKQEHLLIDCSQDLSIWVLVFKPKLVERHATHSTREILRSSDPGSILCRQLESQVVDHLNAVYQNASIGQEDHGFANSALAYALLASWQSFQASEKSSGRMDVHPAVAKAAHLISEGNGDIPLNELARRSGLSASRLSRLFKSQMGISLTTFRQRKSLERFLRIYQTGARYTLIEAAFLAGFGSYAQFHRIFHHFMGKSPADYSRSVRQDQAMQRLPQNAEGKCLSINGLAHQVLKTT